MNLYSRIMNNDYFKSILDELKEIEKDRMFCKHGFDHIINVARIAYIISLEEQADISKDLIYSAAFLHDLGRIEEYKNNVSHDEASVDIADVILKECDASSDEIIILKEVISHHRGHINDLHEEDFSSKRIMNFVRIIKNADKLSRECYHCQSRMACKWPLDKMNNNVLY